MKTFRCPFSQVDVMKFELPLFTCMIVVLAILTYISTDKGWAALLFVVIMSLIFYPAFFTRFFYVVLTEDRLIVQNSIYKFWRKTYLYRDIRKVEFNVARYVYMKVSTGKGNKFSWFHMIGQVAPDDYDDLMLALDERGIVVESISFDLFYPKRKRSERVTPEIEKRWRDKKVFRQNLGSVKSAQQLGVTLLFIALFGGPFVMIFLPPLTYLLLVALCLIVYFMCFSRCYYVILTEYQLIINNGLNYIKRWDLFFNEIARVKFIGGKKIYMEVILRDVALPKRYDIAMVPPGKIGELVADLKAKGVSVELENLDIW